MGSAFCRVSHRLTGHVRMVGDLPASSPMDSLERHCQVVGDDIVTRQQKALSGCDFHRPEALVHKYTQLIEFIMFIYFTKKNVTY